MTARAIMQVLQSAPATALPGTWKLARGRAITLRPTTDGILRVAHGRVWATLEGPHGRGPHDSGDHVLEVGRSMLLRAGQKAVIEALNTRGASYFAWDPIHAAAHACARAGRRVHPALVLQPLRDLRLAAALGVRALAQLGAGLARLGWEIARGARAGRRPHGVTG